MLFIQIKLVGASLCSAQNIVSLDSVAIVSVRGQTA